MGFSGFIRERQFLSNVSPSNTGVVRQWLNTESPTQEDLKAAVLRMREKGLWARSCNSAIHAYVHWANAGHRKPESLLFANIGGNGAPPPQRAALRKAALSLIGIHRTGRTLHVTRHTTKRYAHMTTEDLQAVHERLSLPSR